MFINENAGIIILIFGILILAALGVLLWLTYAVHRRFASVRLQFTGLQASDLNAGGAYAALIVGNNSVREIALQELGVRCGNVAYDLTAVYKRQQGLGEEAHVVIEQRRSIRFRLDGEALASLGAGSKKRVKLRLYAVDLTGNVYGGRIRAVERMLAALPPASAEGSLQQA